MLRLEADTLIEASPDHIRNFLHHLDRLPWFDERIGIIEDRHEEVDGRTSITVCGRLASRPYRAKLSLAESAQGLEAELVDGPIPWMGCRLTLHPVGPYTRLHRVELYDFGPGWSGRVTEHSTVASLKRAIARSQRTLKVLLEADSLLHPADAPQAA